jgi:glutathione S-transferase
VRLFGARVTEELMSKFGEVVRRVLFEPQRDEDEIAAATRAFLEALEPWDRHFHGRTFAVGDELTLADVTLYPVFPALQRIAGVDIPAEHSHLRAWRDRMAARPTTEPPKPNG